MAERGFIDRNKESRDRLQALADRLSDEDLRKEVQGGWTVAVTLAHVAFFDRRAARLIERWQRHGVSPSPYDADAINDAMLPAWLLIPPKAAANEAIVAASEADAAVANLPDELLAMIRDRSDIRLERAQHRNSHLDEIESLLA